MIYWGDETGIDNCSNCERGFAPKGQPPVLPVETKRERLNMLSALSRQGNVRFMLYEDSMNQQRLIQFMDRLIRTSNQKVFLRPSVKSCVSEIRQSQVWSSENRVE